MIRGVSSEGAHVKPSNIRIRAAKPIDFPKVAAMHYPVWRQSWTGILDPYLLDMIGSPKLWVEESYPQSLKCIPRRTPAWLTTSMPRVSGAECTSTFTAPRQPTMSASPCRIRRLALVGLLATGGISNAIAQQRTCYGTRLAISVPPALSLPGLSSVLETLQGASNVLGVYARPILDAGGHPGNCAEPAGPPVPGALRNPTAVFGSDDAILPA